MNDINQRRKSAFAQRIPLYQKDPVLFATEVCDFKPDDWQIDVLRDIAEYPRVSVRSGQGVGKTSVEAITILWFLTCFKFARVVATAPTLHQLHDVLWSEIDKWLSRSTILKQLLTWTKTYVYFNGYSQRWFAVARTASSPESMQGFHEDSMLFVCDEASGIANDIMEAIFGTLSGVNNKLLMCANPTQVTGAFYDSHNKDRAMYRCHRVNSLEVKRTNKENIQSLIRKYGEESNVVKVRVYGDFPSQEDDAYIPLSLVEKAVATEFPKERPVRRISMGVDVARYGDDETVIATNVGGKIELPIIRHGQGLMRTVGDIVSEYRRLVKENPKYEGVIVVNIDDTGLGGGVTDRLEEVKIEEHLNRLEIVPVNFGRRSPDHVFGDITTFMWSILKEAMVDGEISLCNDDELVAQLSVRKYMITSSAKIILEPKKAMKDRGIKSPDRADAVTLSCFVESKIYESYISNVESVVIPAEAVRGMNIMQVNIGISIGTTHVGTSIVATAICANHAKAVVLACKRVTGEVETDKLEKEFADFVDFIRSQYGNVEYAYCEPKEKFLFRAIKQSVESNNLPLTVRVAMADDPNNRIRLTTRLMTQNRLFLVHGSTESLAKAFETAVWSDKNMKDARSTDCDIGMLNAFEYTIERESGRFLQSEGGL